MTPQELCEFCYKYSDTEMSEHKSFAMQTSMGQLMDWLGDGSVYDLSEFFTNVDETKLNILFLTGLLRCTFAHGHQIPGWEEFRVRGLLQGQKLCEVNGKSDRFDMIFRGLINPDRWLSPFDKHLDKLLGIHEKFQRD